MKIRTISIISLLILVPNFLYAAGPLGSLVDLANTLAGGVVTSLGYLMFTLAVVAFLWGMVNFIWAARNGDSGKGFENGKQFMMWGLVSLFVMFSVWGIIKFAQNVFSIQNETSIVIPNIKLLGAPVASSNTSTNTDCPYNTTCTTKDGSGATVSGYCNTTNQCVPTRAAAGSGVTTVCPNGPRSVCSITDINGKTVNGICSSTGTCDVSPSSNTSAAAADPICLAYGSSTGCTIIDMNGKTTAGHCNASNKCVLDSVTTTSSNGASSVKTLSFNQSCEPEAVSLNADEPGQNIPLCGAGLSCPYDDIVCKISDGLACQNDTDCSVYHSKCLAGRSAVKICTPIK